MIITRTPFRVSFAGGGSDLRDFYCKRGYGAVVSTAIKKYMYIIIHPYFQSKIRLKYSKTEDVENVDEIEHPIIRESLKKLQVERGIEIASFADVPAGTGLGSSSSFTVGLLNALYAYRGCLVSKERLAEEACEIEIDILKEPIGKQDQYAAAYGNMNFIQFNSDETVNVEPIMLNENSKRRLEDLLRLYHVGGERRSSDVLVEQRRNMDMNYGRLEKMVSLAEELRDALHGGKTEALGSVLRQGWEYKRDLASGVSCGIVDDLYQKAIKYGASGAKLLGAGGTGFLLVCSENHRYMIDRVGCKVLPFEIDREGTRVIFSN